MVLAYMGVHPTDAWFEFQKDVVVFERIIQRIEHYISMRWRRVQVRVCIQSLGDVRRRVHVGGRY
jgi:hypothetical protein